MYKWLKFILKNKVLFYSIIFTVANCKISQNKIKIMGFQQTLMSNHVSALTNVLTLTQTVIVCLNICKQLYKIQFTHYYFVSSISQFSYHSQIFLIHCTSMIQIKPICVNYDVSDYIIIYNNSSHYLFQLNSSQFYIHY